MIRKEGSCDDGVIFFDLVDYGIEGYNKFIPYYLFPDSAYTVSVSTSSFRTKVSVGSNPWVTEPLRHNLATICERYGGGGHAKVGAISFPTGRRARSEKGRGRDSRRAQAVAPKRGRPLKRERITNTVNVRPEAERGASRLTTLRPAHRRRSSFSSIAAAAVAQAGRRCSAARLSSYGGFSFTPPGLTGAT